VYKPSGYHKATEPSLIEWISLKQAAKNEFVCVGVGKAKNVFRLIKFSKLAILSHFT
jgi:hypothetical protein